LEAGALELRGSEIWWDDQGGASLRLFSEFEEEGEGRQCARSGRREKAEGKVGSIYRPAGRRGLAVPVDLRG